jgi:hypothetical protein
MLHMADARLGSCAANAKLQDAAGFAVAGCLVQSGVASCWWWCIVPAMQACLNSAQARVAEQRLCLIAEGTAGCAHGAAVIWAVFTCLFDVDGFCACLFAAVWCSV